MSRIFIIGDSVGDGFVDSQGGWVFRLRNKIFDSTKLIVDGIPLTTNYIRNISTSGDTAFKAIHRVESEIVYRAGPGSDHFAVIALGDNDSTINDLDIAKKILDGTIENDGKDLKSPEVSTNYFDFIDAYKLLLQKVTNSINKINNHTNATIFVMGLLPTGVKNSVPTIFGCSAIQSRIDLYDQVVRNTVDEFNSSKEFNNKFIYIDTKSFFPKSLDELDKLIPDGLHPFEEGHELIATHMFKILYEYLDNI